MSTSMAERARAAALHAKLLQQVAERFPDATMDRLWDDGPMVVVVADNAEADAAADRLMCVNIGGKPHLVRYFFLRDEEEELAVVVGVRSYMIAVPAACVFAALDKKLYGALVRAVGEYPKR